MLLIISDACVLIDIECGELTSAMFSLSCQFAVPDTLFVEELEERHAHLLQFGLISKTMTIKSECCCKDPYFSSPPTFH